MDASFFFFFKERSYTCLREMQFEIAANIKKKRKR